jgi:hypothetical protein
VPPACLKADRQGDPEKNGEEGGERLHQVGGARDQAPLRELGQARGEGHPRNESNHAAQHDHLA